MPDRLHGDDAALHTLDHDFPGSGLVPHFTGRVDDGPRPRADAQGTTFPGRRVRPAGAGDDHRSGPTGGAPFRHGEPDHRCSAGGLDAVPACGRPRAEHGVRSGVELGCDKQLQRVEAAGEGGDHAGQDGAPRAIQSPAQCRWRDTSGQELASRGEAVLLLQQRCQCRLGCWFKLVHGFHPGPVARPGCAATVICGEPGHRAVGGGDAGPRPRSKAAPAWRRRDRRRDRRSPAVVVTAPDLRRSLRRRRPARVRSGPGPRWAPTTPVTGCRRRGAAGRSQPPRLNRADPSPSGSGGGARFVPAIHLPIARQETWTGGRCGRPGRETPDSAAGNVAETCDPAIDRHR